MFNETLYKDSIASRTRLMETMFARGLISSRVQGIDFRMDSDETIEVDSGEIFVSDPTNQNFKFQKVNGGSGITHPSGVASRIDILANGSIDVISFTGQMTELEKVQGKVQIGVIGHANLTDIDSEFTTISALFGMSIPGNQDMFANGIRSVSGLELVLNADLTFGAKAGVFIDPLAPEIFNCPEQPYRNATIAVSQFGVDVNTQMFRSWFGNAGIGGFRLNGTPISTVDAAVWDDPIVVPGVGSAPTEVLSGLESQNISVHIAQSKTGQSVILQYGRIKYPKIADAVIGAQLQIRDNIPVVKGTRFAGLISLWRGATDMTDPTHAFFTSPNTILVGTF